MATIATQNQKKDESQYSVQKQCEQMEGERFRPLFCSGKMRILSFDRQMCFREDLACLLGFLDELQNKARVKDLENAPAIRTKQRKNFHVRRVPNFPALYSIRVKEEWYGKYDYRSNVNPPAGRKAV